MKVDIKTVYSKKIISRMTIRQVYMNSRQVPKIVKICLNKGVGEAAKASKELDLAAQDLVVISGQMPRKNKAKKSVAGFQIRDGMPVGCSVTLRRDRMYAFLAKLIYIAFPRIRDFKGISCRGFDGKGNYNVGISDQSIFSEIPYEHYGHGLDISIVTSTSNNLESYELLRLFGMPFIDQPRK